ncbi:thioredoxin [Thermaerobacter subterraneus]|uniref:Thioredoxin n=1 Tax=Thermaerobacter subterraneus DSM 13965 TaxID=867903 RepID=K6NY15_9FIRM|nr:thioredoxin [Thermaerobacter subterraneus]EKP93765.1 thioredoxin [Thermaerobacter subterraneus DSM 13965]
MAAGILDLTAEQFDAEVLQSDQPVLVDFWAPWCGPCRMIAPIVEEIAQEYAGRLKVAKLNVDDHGVIAGRYGVMSIPTLLVFKGGQPVARIVGFRPKEELEQEILKAIG